MTIGSECGIVQNPLIRYATEVGELTCHQMKSSACASIRCYAATRRTYASTAISTPLDEQLRVTKIFVTFSTP